MTDRGRGSYGALVVGIVLLIVGGGFLLRSAGLIDVEWSILWPAIIIAVGIVLILGAVRHRGGRGGTGDERVALPVDGAARLELSLRLGAGRYRLRGGTSGGLVEATADEPTIACRAERLGDLARVRLSTAVDPWTWGWRGAVSWQIAIATGVPTVLDVQAGAGDFELDLSAIALASASMSIGAAQLTIVLPHPVGDVPVRVEAGRRASRSASRPASRPGSPPRAS
jgi:hypothetical protein